MRDVWCERFILSQSTTCLLAVDLITPHHTTPHHTTSHYTTPYHTTPHHTTPHHTTHPDEVIIRRFSGPWRIHNHVHGSLWNNMTRLERFMLSTHFSIHSSIHPPINHPFTHFSIRPSIHPPIHLSIIHSPTNHQTIHPLTLNHPTPHSPIHLHIHVSSMSL